MSYIVIVIFFISFLYLYKIDTLVRELKILKIGI